MLRVETLWIQRMEIFKGIDSLNLFLKIHTYKKYIKLTLGHTSAGLTLKTHIIFN